MKNKAALNNVNNITSVPLDIQDSTLFKWQNTETRVVQLHGREEGFGEDMGLVWSGVFLHLVIFMLCLCRSLLLYCIYSDFGICFYWSYTVISLVLLLQNLTFPKGIP